MKLNLGTFVTQSTKPESKNKHFSSKVSSSHQNVFINKQSEVFSPSPTHIKHLEPIIKALNNEW